MLDDRLCALATDMLPSNSFGVLVVPLAGGGDDMAKKVLLGNGLKWQNK